jgi:SAM-dependent methyltransferase
MKPEQSEDWRERQRSYYDRFEHRYLSPSAGGRYAENITAKLWSMLGADASSRGLELGCGAGRFTLPLLARCRSLDVVDLSPARLERLAAALAAKGIGRERCRLHCASAEQLDATLPEAGFDFVAGFFMLHHLHEPGIVLRQAARLLRPGARVGFVEPNRWNPLYLLQIAASPDMRWREEKRLYRLGERTLRRMLVEAELEEIEIQRAGLFPPAILNASPRALAFEHRVERLRWYQPVAPFLLLSGRRPGG